MISTQSIRINFLVRPLQRMCVGGLLTASAFVVSGLLELRLQPTYDRIPAVGESHLHFMNSLDCPVSVRIAGGESDVLVDVEER